MKNFYITSNHDTASAALNELFEQHDPGTYEQDIAANGIDAVATEERANLIEQGWAHNTETSTEGEIEDHWSGGDMLIIECTPADLKTALLNLARL